MLLESIIQRTQSLYSKGVQSDDSRLSPRHIYNKLLTTRAKIYLQKINKKQKISQWSYQTISCIEMEEVSKHECDCLPDNAEDTRCPIFRSKYPIPSVLTSYGKHQIQSVTSVDGNYLYSEISWVEAKYKLYNKYTRIKSDFYMRNNYLFLTFNKQEDNNNSTTTVVSMTALFNNPQEADNFISFCPDGIVDCESPMEKEFPMDLDLVDLLVEMSYKELVAEFSQNREDITNNTRDNGEK